jgi:hypothetical protein
MELDIFLPNEQLAFEYQGEQHYHDIYNSMGLLWQRKRQDEEKKELCKEKGITLIDIPYWWDRKLNSLAETIRQQRFNILTNHIGGDPIPVRSMEDFGISLRSYVGTNH